MALNQPLEDWLSHLCCIATQFERGILNNLSLENVEPMPCALKYIAG